MPATPAAAAPAHTVPADTVPAAAVAELLNLLAKVTDWRLASAAGKAAVDAGDRPGTELAAAVAEAADRQLSRVHSTLRAGQVSTPDGQVVTGAVGWLVGQLRAEVDRGQDD